MNKPQLSAELEKRLLDLLPLGLDDWIVEDIKHFLATALEEQRQELLSEVESWLDEMPIWIKIEGKYGYDPIHNKADISPFRQELRAKLNQLKGAE